MILETALQEWNKHVSWPLLSQVEQDLVISRALVEIFNNDYLKSRVAFRGGTALNKLIFPHPLRYSEDIDLNRLEKGPAKKLIDEIRNALDEMLGQPKKVKSTDLSIKMIYHYPSVDGGTGKLKIEINIRETLPQKDLNKIPFEVKSLYFTGKTTIMAFDTEEMIGTKIRALYQRNKGRDLFDLYELGKLAINWDEVIKSFHKLKIGAGQKEFAPNLEEKMKDAEFLEDMIPLLPKEVSYNINDAYEWFCKVILPKL